MGTKSKNMLDFDFEDRGLPKIARDFRNKYRRIHKTLMENPEIIELAKEDLKKLLDGEEGIVDDNTIETIIRALIVYFAERKSLTKTIVLIWESEFLQCFTKNPQGKVMEHAFLDRCLNALSPETVEAIHKVIGLRSKRRRTKTESNQ